MFGFKFEVSVEDTAILQKAKAGGAIVTIDLENFHGGLFLKYKSGHKAVWTFSEELDLTDGVMHVADTDLTKIVDLALEIFPAKGLRKEPTCFFVCEVSAKDHALLSRLANSGWHIILDLRHGIGAVYPGAGYVKWTFISEVAVMSRNGKSGMWRFQDVSEAVAALERLNADQNHDAIES